LTFTRTPSQDKCTIVTAANGQVVLSVGIAVPTRSGLKAICAHADCGCKLLKSKALDPNVPVPAFTLDQVAPLKGDVTRLESTKPCLVSRQSIPVHNTESMAMIYSLE
jgi:hypothetical protein